MNTALFRQGAAPDNVKFSNKQTNAPGLWINVGFSKKKSEPYPNNFQS